MEESPYLGTGVIVKALCALIRIYQWQSPLWGQRCRFYPSCSEYMHEALQTLGLLKGIRCGVVRILKCHPWHAGGVDLVKVSDGK